MQIATATVVGGKVIVEGLDLAEGETVTVLTQESEQEVHLSPEDEAELLEAIAIYHQDGKSLPPATSGRDYANKMQNVA